MVKIPKIINFHISSFYVIKKFEKTNALHQIQILSNYCPIHFSLLLFQKLISLFLRFVFWQVSAWISLPFNIIESATNELKLLLQ